jgi:hypothetical protein
MGPARCILAVLQSVQRKHTDNPPKEQQFQSQSNQTGQMISSSKGDPLQSAEPDQTAETGGYARANLGSTEMQSDCATPPSPSLFQIQVTPG